MAFAEVETRDISDRGINLFPVFDLDEIVAANVGYWGVWVVYLGQLVGLPNHICLLDWYHLNRHLFGFFFNNWGKCVLLC